MKRLLPTALLLMALLSTSIPEAQAQYSSTTQRPSLWSRLFSRVKPANPYPEYGLGSYLRGVTFGSILKQVLPGSRRVVETRYY